MIRDYQIIRPQIPLLAQSQKENDQQKEQIEHLTSRIRQITQKMGVLQELDFKLKLMVNLGTSDENTQFQGVGGPKPNSFNLDDSMKKNDQALAQQLHLSVNKHNNETAPDKQVTAELNKFIENQKIFLFSTPSIWPTKGLLSSRFGYRISSFTGEKEFHSGIDISTRMNAPIVAPADGIVLSTGKNHLSGNMISINHGYGLITRYTSLQKTLVKKGQYVKQGETVALVGNTGSSPGPHLHYEVHLNGIPADPLRHILHQDTSTVERMK